MKVFNADNIIEEHGEVIGEKINWNFDEMALGDIISYMTRNKKESFFAKKAQAACYTFARSRNKKFKTFRHYIEGEPCMMIHRIK